VSLQEICLTGQLLIEGLIGCAVRREIDGKYADGEGDGKNVVFIVYNIL